MVHFKTQFQEYVHQQNKGDVTYNLIKKKDRHIIVYSLQVILQGEAIAEGKGKTKKKSEQHILKVPISN
ncbi:putative dsRNA-binding protein [Staphylococcus aureus]